MVLDVMVETGLTLKALANDLKLYPQTMINMVCEEPKALAQNDALLVLADVINKELGDDGRVLIRASGTEPKIRLMVEAKDAAIADTKANELHELAKTLVV